MDIATPSALFALPAMDAAASPPPDDRQSPLRGAFLFARWLIVTYHAAVLAVVMIVALRHLYQRWGHYQILRDQMILSPSRSDQASNEDDNDNIRSSGSSDTLQGSGSDTSSELGKHGKDTASETDHLLGRPIPSSRSLIQRLIARVEAALMYQPAPLPLFNRTMPSNGTSLAIIAYLGLQLFYLLFRTTGPIAVLANRAGLLFIANLPWLYLLGAKTQPIKLLTGYSYENLNLLHRRLGEWMCLLAVVHAAGMIVAWYQFIRPLGFSFIHFITLRYILFGVFAFLCYETLYVTSLSSFRAWWYEVFLGIHVVLQAAALVLLFFHHPETRVYVGVSLAIFSVDRVVFRLLLKSTTIVADIRVLEDGETTMVSANWPVKHGSLGMSIRSGWKPSSHVFITLPALSNKHKLQAHPMTIASAAPLTIHGDQHEGQQQHAWFNLLIRAQDGFSRDLLDYAHAHSSATVRIDGPYGSLHALHLLETSNTAVVVAGGSGIAVAYPMIWALIHSPSSLHYQSRHHRHQSRCGAKNRGKVVLIWIVHDARHYSWIERVRLEELRELGVEVVLPRPTREAGERPDVKLLVREVVGEKEGNEGHRVGVVVSGPDGLNRDVRNACADMRREGRRVRVEVEKFGW